MTAKRTPPKRKEQDLPEGHKEFMQILAKFTPEQKERALEALLEREDALKSRKNRKD